ncbi:hypothetical protein H4582DRAFT_2077103 [Lactarius indigo]|nr:hypothetical protein H4582DRAFT_2077103 [Lactarius indigo]
MSIAVYAGGQSNGSPSAEVKPGLDWETLMLALLALNTPDSCEIFVVRMLRNRTDTWTSTCASGRVPGRSRTSAVPPPAEGEGTHSSCGDPVFGEPRESKLNAIVIRHDPVAYLGGRAIFSLPPAQNQPVGDTLNIPLAVSRLASESLIPSCTPSPKQAAV